MSNAPERSLMRVLYINPFSQQISGTDESLIELLREIVPRGVQAHVVLPSPGPQVTRYEETNAIVHFAPMSVLSRGLRPWQLPRFGVEVLRGTRAILRIAREVRADLIHSNMEVVLDGGLAARRLGIPHVLHYRGNTLDRPTPVFDVLTRIWVGLSDRTLCISHATSEIFRKRKLMEKVEVVYDPISLARFRAAERSSEVRRSLGAAEMDLLVGTVARIHPRKDLETFIKAAALACSAEPRLRFAIVGAPHGEMETAYLERVRAMAVALGVANRMVFSGARTDIPEVMKALDVFVLCSRHEGFGRVVPEAMGAGVPVILTREGALTELIEDGQEGLFADAEDAAAFSAHILSMARDTAMRRTMGEQALRRSDDFDAQNSANRVLAVYERLRA